MKKQIIAVRANVIGDTLIPNVGVIKPTENKNILSKYHLPLREGTEAANMYAAGYRKAKEEEISLLIALKELAESYYELEHEINPHLGTDIYSPSYNKAIAAIEAATKI